MHITLSPQVRDDHVVIYKYKDTLVINSEEFDFARIKEGDVLPAFAVSSEYVVDSITRKNGIIHLAVIAPVRWDSPENKMFPVPIVDAKDGKVFDSEEDDEY